MSKASYTIRSGDYEGGGSAARSLKEQLKKIGAPGDAIRRAMIAAYEAEMNVVIHSVGGRLVARLDDGRLDVEVVDDGPGIPDVDLAMKEGFSTASSQARELGFGAGMGLPNIKRNSDVFEIRSDLGKGTRLAFSIFLRAQQPVAPAGGHGSLQILSDRCNECFHCLRACPTRALRIRQGRPRVLEHLCLDCGTCIAACPSGALTMSGTTESLVDLQGARLVVPPPLLVQFGAGVTSQRVLAVLAAELGFGEVCVTEPWERELRVAVLEHARHSKVRPVISPACPAIVNLIEMRYPSLIDHIAPLAPPVQSACAHLGDGRTAVVALCPCQRSALEAVRAAAPGRLEIIVPSTLRTAAMPFTLMDADDVGRSSPKPADSAGGADGAAAQAASSPQAKAEALQVTGIAHVMNILEKVENGLMDDVAVLELYVCDQGCFGSPLLSEDPFAARHRWLEMPWRCQVGAKAIRRETPYQARPGVRLDERMDLAIEKLAQIEKLTRTLPGKDCGICGCPTCAAFAEDVVLGRIHGVQCAYKKRSWG